MSILAMDDLKAGQYVTMYKGQRHEERIVESFLSGSKIIAAFEDHRYKGDVLKITAVDLPFVVVEHCGGIFETPSTFDLRDGWQFKKLSKELSKEYIEAALARRLS